MSNWNHIRLAAREFYAEVRDSGDKPISAKIISTDELLTKAKQLTGIKAEGYPEGHPLLQKSLARLERNTIFFNSSVEHWLTLYYQAHELAHIKLGHGERHCTASDIDSDATEDKLPLGVHRVEGYSPHERIECEANMFAREFLLPCDVLKYWFIETGLTAEEIAITVGGSINMVEMVCHQLARALLTPEITSEEKSDSENTTFTLDESQQEAAESSKCPLLISAGPGTGKTRTLAGRILYLLNQNIPPETILVLTFSNKAAEELRDRVKLVAPSYSQKIRVETFHSFGLELLRKYGTNIGLPINLVILDPVDALFILERHLPQLNLDHYQNLYEPTMFLNDILKAISRAKDENVMPNRYKEMAQKMHSEGTSNEEITAAEKVLEIARVYEFYQEYLVKQGVLDFGDLICRSIELLQNHPKVKKEVQQNYQHILVDEYQDVNRASGLLLGEIAGDGTGLWAVGDVRQSIHRWRGATTANMRSFAKDFPKAADPLSLQVNYRSQGTIVNTFSEFVPQMSAVKEVAFTAWQKNRGEEGGIVKYEIAVDGQAEVQGIAHEIKENVKIGIPYREQAIICRSHTSLERIAHYLEQEGVPVLYLGDFFERSEVRDMLSIFSLACEPDGRGLLRVARFPEYDIPLADVQSFRSFAKEKKKPFPEALNVASEAEGISVNSQEKFLLLARHLEGLCYGRSAWLLLTRYLFVRSNYLRPLVEDNSIEGQQRRLALYPFLQFIHSQIGRSIESGVDPKRALLRYIRRLEVYGEERQLRQVPAWADGIDAVRVLTIHASKGLEFRAVFLPVLAKAYMPIKKMFQRCLPPKGMISEENDDWHLEEEECLFFVAMSRAKDYLCLSRPVRYGQINPKPSDFLAKIAKQLPVAVDDKVTWSGNERIVESAKASAISRDEAEQSVFEERHLDVYMTCPRKYYYEFVLGLSGKRDETAYVQFHQCVYEVLHLIREKGNAGEVISNESAQSILDEIWQTKGPIEHPYQELYRDKANEMIGNALSRTHIVRSQTARTKHIAKLSNGSVSIKFDYAELIEDDGSPSTLLVQRLRTGRPTKTEADKEIYGLYHLAAQQFYPEAKLRLQTLYLSTNETNDVDLTKQKLTTRLKKYDEAIASILKAHFNPTPNERECPRCPHYFICPMAEEI